MKLNFKFPVLFFAIAILTIVSCKDEVSLEENRSKMLGNWKATTFSQANCNDDAENFVLAFDDEEGACFQEEVEIVPGFPQEGTICVIVDFTFLDSGVLTSNFNTSLSVAGVPVGSESQSSTGTWEILDISRMTVCLENEEGVLDCSTGTYTVNDTTLTYNGNDSDTGCDVSFIATKQ